MGGVQSATKSATRSVIREEYQNKESCQLAAGASAAGLAADAFNSKGAQNMADSVGLIALMRCVGKSYTFIILFHVILLCIVVACAILIPPAIPDDVWKNCTTCIRHTGTGKNRRCIESRPGTPQECKRAGRVFEFIIAIVVGGIISAIISGIYTFYLKSKVFRPSALFAETAGRMLF